MRKIQPAMAGMLYLLWNRHPVEQDEVLPTNKYCQYQNGQNANESYAITRPIAYARRLGSCNQLPFPYLYRLVGQKKMINISDVAEFRVFFRLQT